MAVSFSSHEPVGALDVSPGTGGPVILHDVSWESYEAILAALGDDHPSLRLTYREGTLEIMTTSPYHELVKKIIARLLEMWAVERDVALTGYGAATFRTRTAKRGLEPDECYVLHELVDVPDIAIEVVHRHHDIDKLDVYAGLGVPEVWIWEEGRLAVYRLTAGRYERHERSELLPNLDLVELSSFVRTDVSQTEAIRAYRDALRRLR
jgi:Uma2 family endonuclease